MLEELQNETWLDRDTRALVISMNLFTPPRDLLSSVNILFEWSAEGPVQASLSVHSSKLHLYQDKRESIVSSAEVGIVDLLRVIGTQPISYWPL